MDLIDRVLRLISIGEYCRNRYRHDLCCNLTKMFSTFINQKGKRLENDCVLTLFEYIHGCDKFEKYRLDKCSDQSEFQTLLLIFAKYNDEEISKKMLKFNVDSEILEIIKNNILSNKFTNIDTINECISKLKIISIDLLKKIKPNHKTLQIICDCEDDAAFSYIFSQKMDIYHDLLDIIIKKQNLTRLKLLLNCGYVLNDKHLEYACRTTKTNIIKCVLDHKIIPSQKCINELLIGCDALFKSVPNYQKKQVEQKKIELNNTITNIIELFVDRGYVLTYEDICEITKNKYKINNIKKYNIQFKNDFIELCSSINYYPYSQSETNVKVGSK